MARGKIAPKFVPLEGNGREISQPRKQGFEGPAFANYEARFVGDGLAEESPRL